MATFEAGDLIKVPFPYTDRSVRQRRPALVVSGGEVAEHGLLWVVMVTSADNRGWRSDVAIPDHVSAGLPAPSVVRPAKIATIEARDAEPLGRAPEDVIRAVLAAVSAFIGA